MNTYAIRVITPGQPPELLTGEFRASGHALAWIDERYPQHVAASVMRIDAPADPTRAAALRWFDEKFEGGQQ